MNKLTRQQLEIINRRTIRYPLQIAEKDYFLALAIQLVYTSPLAQKLIFKGGAAVHHCYLDQKRFSEDLDFTSLDTDLSAEEIGAVLESDEISSLRLTITKMFCYQGSRSAIEMYGMWMRSPL